ncbi:MAG: DUF4012 domain-containing protein [Actinobacteria bacterium]|nr:DUF4012 domain-containing protein [Actinomycetota bacterium]
MPLISRSRRRAFVVVAVSVGLAIAVWLAFMVLDALAARDALVEARAALGDVRESLGNAEVEEAEASASHAFDATVRAGARIDGPVWWLARRSPVIRRTALTITHAVGIATAAADLSGDVVPRANELLGPDGELAVAGGDGRIDLESIRRAEGVLQELGTGALESSYEALADTPATLLPASVLDGRRDALELAGQTLETIDDARTLTRVLPDVLGDGEERRYLLAIQNSAELRGTGGLIGFLGELVATQGRVEFRGPIDASELEPATGPPVQAPDEFEERYAHVEATSFLKNVNVDPHLPMTAPVLLALYANATGDVLDGVIMVDPVALQIIARATGVVDVPDELLEGVEDLPDPLPPDELARVVMFDAYQEFGGSSEERDRYLAAVLTSAFERLIVMDWDPTVMTRRIGIAGARRHLQIYSAREDEQRALESLGVAGAMQPRPWGDLLAMSANNAAANKQDVHVGHGARLDLTLRIPVPDRPTDAERHARFEVIVDNPLPSSGLDPYIIGSRPGGAGSDSGPTGAPGLNRTWFTVWSPSETRVLAGRDGQDQPISVTTGGIHDQTAVDHYLETPSRERRSFELDLSGPIELRRDGPDLRYRLTLWRQAKGIPDDIEVLIRAPRGWEVADASLSGGRQGGDTGLGTDVLDGPEEPTLERHRGHVTVRGEVNTDVVIELRLARGPMQRLGDRLTSWLGW